MVCYLMEKKKSGGHRPKEYANTYGRVVKTATKKLIENVTEFFNHCSWEKAPKWGPAG